MTFKLIDIENLQALDSRNIEFLLRLTLQKSTNSICDNIKKKNRK